MKTKFLFIGVFSFGLAAVLWLLDKTRYVFIFGQDPMRRLIIYPAAFFGLLGLMFLFWSLKPVLFNAPQK